MAKLHLGELIGSGSRHNTKMPVCQAVLDKILYYEQSKDYIPNKLQMDFEGFKKDLNSNSLLDGASTAEMSIWALRIISAIVCIALLIHSLI